MLVFYLALMLMCLGAVGLTGVVVFWVLRTRQRQLEQRLADVEEALTEAKWFGRFPVERGKEYR